MQTRIWCSLLLLAAASCYSDRTVGVSKGDKPDEPAPTKAKFPTRIAARPGEILTFADPRAGDVDGDGFEDFVLVGQLEHDSGNFQPNMTSMYLFYGREEFPEQLSTSDADAVFAVDSNWTGGPAGDLNGDGLSDLMLMRLNSVEFVFGSKQRLHGAIAPNSAGASWMAGELPPPFAAGFTTEFLTRRAGDLDGDGCTDLIVGATALLGPEPDGTGGGLVQRPYLIRGHRGTWESAVFNPNWAAAGFGFDSGRLSSSDGLGLGERSLLYPERAGDLDADGRDDLIASGQEGALVFYGRPEYPREVTSSDSEARLLPAANGADITVTPESWVLGQAWGDLDGDDMDDIAILDPIHGSIAFVYGRRWSGEVQLDPQLQIELEMPGVQHVQGVSTGDIDGDGFPELLLNVQGLSATEFDEFGAPLPAPQSLSAIYVLRGTGERLTGTVKLTPNERWQPRGVVFPNNPESMFELTIVGDVDGDGGQDVLTNSTAATPDGMSNIQMFLVPSTPRSPD